MGGGGQSDLWSRFVKGGGGVVGTGELNEINAF